MVGLVNAHIVFHFGTTYSLLHVPQVCPPPPPPLPPPLPPPPPPPQVQRTMLELLNQLDGFTAVHDIKVSHLVIKPE